MTERRKSTTSADPWQQVREPRQPVVVERQAPPPAAAAETGSNPYDTFPNLRANDVGRRQSDLRRLSEWIRLKRQVEALKSGKPK
jgi:hypothetical protein